MNETLDKAVAAGAPPASADSSQADTTDTATADRSVSAAPPSVPVMPDIAVFNEIIQIRRDFLGMPTWGQERYDGYKYPQRLCALSDMNRCYVLREAGDLAKYLELESKINAMPGKQESRLDSCIFEMAQWVDAEIAALLAMTSDKEKLVITLLVYGKEYTQKCLDVNFKSLMAAGNLPALCKERQVILHVQTTEDTQTMLESAPIVDRMKALGVKFEYCIIPDALMGKLNTDTFYWLVGAAASIAVQYAKKNGAAFSHSYPDLIYSERFFSELLRLSKFAPSVLSVAHRTDEAVIMPMLEPYATEEVIAVPSADLVAIGLNAIHMAHFPFLINHRPGMWHYPRSHYVMWESPHLLHFNCPHLNALWLSAEVLSKVTRTFFHTIDSELDFFVEGENFYIPQENDDLYLTELSNQGKDRFEDSYGDAASYAGHFWQCVTNRDNAKFFIRGMKVRINRNIRPIKFHNPSKSGDVIPEDTLMDEKVFLINTIQSKDVAMGTNLTRPRTHANKIYRYTPPQHMPQYIIQPPMQTASTAPVPNPVG